MMILFIGNRSTVNVRDFAAASEQYCRERDESGEGASTFPEGRLMQGGRKVGRVSYNGRVWRLEPGKPQGGGTLAYCPSSVDQDEGRPDVFNEGRESVWGKARGNGYPSGSLEHRVFESGAAFARARS